MKQKTPLQDLIELLDTFMIVNDDIPDYYDGLKKASDLAKNLLPKEREVIEMARVDGFMKSGEGFNGEYPYEGVGFDGISKVIENDLWFTQTFEQ